MAFFYAFINSLELLLIAWFLMLLGTAIAGGLNGAEMLQI
jgi:hypothetical protein